MPGQQQRSNGAATMTLALSSPGRLAFGVEEGVDSAAPPPADNRVLHPQRVTVIQELELEPLDMLLLTRLGGTMCIRCYRAPAVTAVFPLCWTCGDGVDLGYIAYYVAYYVALPKS